MNTTVPPSPSGKSGKAGAPDKKLSQLAFMIAIMEKVTSTVGAMNFLWATVVLLGGFAQSLESIDFWFVTTILVVEGLRIQCRRGELRTQVATWRSWSPDFILSFLYVYSIFIQQISAAACIALSAMRIQRQQYGRGNNPNRNRSLNLFYWQSVVESAVTLLGIGLSSLFKESPMSPTENEETMYLFSVVLEKWWPLKLEDYGFEYSDFPMVRRFYFDTYYKCINGSVFDGLKMDFVSYSLELLQSREHIDQRMGARLLCTLAMKYRFKEETMRAIGTMSDVVGRLIEMLNWDKPYEQEIRTAAAEIISKLVGIPRHRIRVMAIPESMESITSLLYDSNEIEMHPKQYECQSSDEYKYSDFTVLGLQILKILANDPEDDCAKIGSNKGLLRKIAELAELNPDVSESTILMHLKSLPIKKRASLSRQQDVVCENIDDPNLKSVSIDQHVCTSTAGSTPFAGGFNPYMNSFSFNKSSNSRFLSYLQQQIHFLAGNTIHPLIPFTRRADLPSINSLVR